MASDKGTRNRETKKKKPVRRKGPTEYKLVSGNMKANALIFIFFALAVTIVIFVHLIVIMRSHGDDFRKQVYTRNSYVSHETKYKRGSITDRNGNVIAESRRVFDLVLDPSIIDDTGKKKSEIKYQEGTEKALEEVFGMKSSAVEKILKADDKKSKKDKYKVVEDYRDQPEKKKNRFEKLANKVNQAFKHDKTKEDKELEEKYGTRIGGVTFEEKYKRYYPYKTVAADLIGYVNDEGDGVFGLESRYNSDMKGEPGKSYRYYTSETEYEEGSKPASDGDNLVSTIDVNVQGVVEQHIASFMDELGANNLGVILMNPNNGEIYAMASDPAYDLNHPDKFGFDVNKFMSEHFKKDERDKLTSGATRNAVWRSFCTSDSYEPGSTFKPFTICAALDEGVTKDGAGFFCDGGQTVGGTYIRCDAYMNGGHGSLDLRHALMYSCNDVLMQLGQKLGKRTFLDYTRLFGFGNKTGIDLPGESPGSVFKAATMSSVDLAISSFGQGQAVTMVQMAAAFSSIVNGGTYYTPHLMKEIDSDSGAVVKKYSDAAVRRTVTENTSSIIRSYLYDTVEGGTAVPAQVAGYKVCGKTGTAEKFPRNHGNYLVSFIGCVPEDNPQLVCYVVIDQPHTSDQAHSTYATMFASSLLEDVLPMLDIKPQKKAGSTAAPAKANTPDYAHGDVKASLPSTKKGNLYEGAPKGGYADKSYNVAEKEINKKDFFAAALNGTSAASGAGVE